MLLAVESDKDMMKLMEKEIENCKEAISELEEEVRLVKVVCFTAYCLEVISLYL